MANDETALGALRVELAMQSDVHDVGTRCALAS